MKLIVISNPVHLPWEHNILISLFENGLQTFHIRKPHFSTARLREYIRQIPQVFQNRLVIHSCHQLTEEFPLKGIHFSEREREKKIPHLLHKENQQLQWSTAFHSLSQLLNDDPRYEYVFLSPVFDSISKAGYRSAFQEADIAAILKKSAHRVIALGGMEMSKIPQIKSLGFFGMALLGAIWKQKDPVSEFKRCLTFIEKPL